MVTKTAFIFPGQGSQYIGMGKSYLTLSQAAEPLLKEANDILGFDLSSIMFEGPEEKLKATDVTQPALFVSSAMALTALREKGIKAQLAAGHSLGEYSALFAAGVVGFADCLKLVQFRGRAMQECALKHPGTMAAIIGLSRDVVGEICQLINKDEGVCVPANFNSSQQTVISGAKNAVTKAMECCAQQGAAKTVELNVAGAFHSPLMSEAANKMAEVLSGVQFKTAEIPVITNVDAAPTSDPAELKAKLIRQIDHSVMWDDTLRVMLAAGTETFVEVGSGKILSSMLRRLDKSKTALWTDDFNAIEQRISTLSVQS